MKKKRFKKEKKEREKRKKKINNWSNWESSPISVGNVPENALRLTHLTLKDFQRKNQRRKKKKKEEKRRKKGFQFWERERKTTKIEKKEKWFTVVLVVWIAQSCLGVFLRKSLMKYFWGWEIDIIRNLLYFLDLLFLALFFLSENPIKKPYKINIWENSPNWLGISPVSWLSPRSLDIQRWDEKKRISREEKREKRYNFVNKVSLPIWVGISRTNWFSRRDLKQKEKKLRIEIKKRKKKKEKIQIL